MPDGTSISLYFIDTLLKIVSNNKGSLNTSGFEIGLRFDASVAGTCLNSIFRFFMLTPSPPKKDARTVCSGLPPSEPLGDLKVRFGPWPQPA